MTRPARKPRAVQYAASDETRIRIMETAERLFGELGIEATPLRTISTQAEQRNTNSVQYHFGDRLGLLRAIFDYREAQLDRLRKLLLEQGQTQDKLDDLRWLLRVCFEPNFRHYTRDNGIAYIKLHATYVSNVRPRGVPHPVDDDSPSTAYFRQAIALLRTKLSFLTRQQFDMRLSSVGAMFLSALIQYDASPPEQRVAHDLLFSEVLDMMVAAISVPHWDPY